MIIWSVVKDYIKKMCFSLFKNVLSLLGLLLIELLFTGGYIYCGCKLLKLLLIVVINSLPCCLLQVFAGASNTQLLPHASHSVAPKVIQLVQRPHSNTAAHVPSNPTWASVGARKRTNEALDSYASDR